MSSMKIFCLECFLISLNVNSYFRAIYFFAYANTKSFLVKEMERETPLVHVTSAAAAGKISYYQLQLTMYIYMKGIAMSTCTNPLWFIKTRLQIDQG